MAIKTGEKVVKSSFEIDSTDIFNERKLLIMMSNRKIRMGMIGGGEGSFIGAVHRMAANLDGQIELVCGAFSSKAEVSQRSGEALFLSPDRVYPDYDTMFQKETALPEGERMDFVAIVTPNHVHFDPAKKALEHGFHVMLDKPMTFDLAEALELEKIVKSSGKLLGLTHTYTGYPLVKEARELVRKGALGNIRKIVVEYPQGWLNKLLEGQGSKQASWRTDPKKSGKAGAMGDIGTHAANLAEYVSGKNIVEVCADLAAVVPGRALDDDGQVLLRFEGGIRGMLMASQISAGEENELKLRIYGEEKSLEWLQSEPNTLWIKTQGGVKQAIRAGADFAHLSDVALAHSRIPSGHPEGYLEAFANLYRNFARAIREVTDGRKPDFHLYPVPDVSDGVRGMAFIDAVVASSEAGQKWTAIQI